MQSSDETLAQAIGKVPTVLAMMPSNEDVALDMDEVRRKVAGADEEAINAFDGRDCFDLPKRRFAFQLHHNAGVKVRVRVISLNAAVVVRAWPNSDSSYAKRRIASSGHRFARLFCALDEGNEERAGAYIERALDHHGVVPWHAEDGLSGTSTHCLQLREKGWDIVRSMFTVDDDPIKTSARDDLRHHRAAESAPQPNLTLKT